MRRPLALAALLVLLTTPSAARAATAWTDSVPATATQTSVTVLPPASVQCSTLLVATTISWAEVDPRYDYTVVVRRTDTGAVTATRTVTGTATSTTFTGLGELGLVLGIGRADLRASVSSFVAATPAWSSATATSSPSLRVDVSLTSVTLGC